MNSVIIAEIIYAAAGARYSVPYTAKVLEIRQKIAIGPTLLIRKVR